MATKRGYSAIALCRPKTEANVGSGLDLMIDPLAGWLLMPPRSSGLFTLRIPGAKP